MAIGSKHVVPDVVKKVVENVSFINEIGANLYRKHRYEEAEYHFQLVMQDLGRARIRFNNLEEVKSLQTNNRGVEEVDRENNCGTSRRSSTSSSRSSSRSRSRRGSSCRSLAVDTYTLLDNPDEPAEIFPFDVEDDFDEFNEVALATMTSHWLCCASMATMHNLVLAALAQEKFKEAQRLLQKALSQWQNEIRHGILNVQLKAAFLNDATSVAQLVSLYYLSGRVLGDMAVVKKEMPSEKEAQNANDLLYLGAIQQYQRALQVGDSLMKKHVSAQHLTLLGTYRWLAEGYNKNQNVIKASEAYRRAVKAFVSTCEDECDPNLTIVPFSLEKQQPESHKVIATERQCTYQSVETRGVVN